jgi:MoxR-like ATPase
MQLPFEETDKKIKEKISEIKIIKKEIGKVIVGQDRVINRILITLLSSGHILLEGVPGLAKTLIVRTIGEVFNLRFKRIQFTPDLLPADLTGTMMFNPKENSFVPRKGPLFTNLLLADEINRAPAKVQSALLEAMEEKQITLSDYTFPLPFPFMVLATQNPIEYEGTFPLPEAELDRFMLKTIVDYPDKREELDIVKKFSKDGKIEVEKTVTVDKLKEFQELINDIFVDSRLQEYIIDIVRATRNPEKYDIKDIMKYIDYGASPRASLYLTMLSKAYAFLDGRGFVIPEDIKELAYDVLRHRIILSYNADADNVDCEKIISEILRTIPIP